MRSNLLKAITSIGVLAIVLALVSSSSDTTWRVEPGESEGEGETAAWFDIPVRESLRYCCTLGTGLKVELYGVPVPFVRAGAVVGIDELGTHHYDYGGLLQEFHAAMYVTWLDLFGSDEGTGAGPRAATATDDVLSSGFSLDPFASVENTGMIYTCRGGIIDVSHIREEVDWMAYFIAKIDRYLGEEVVAELPREGAGRSFHLAAIPDEFIERHDRKALVVALAQWTAYQLSIWHEIAQWYGVAMWDVIPETNSGFSPDDPYANVVGIRLFDDLDYEEVLQSEATFGLAMEKAILAVIEDLGPLDRKGSVAAMEATDGLWWDSTVPIPEREVVIRRERDIDADHMPWLVPPGYGSPELQETLARVCGPDPKPERIRIADRFPDVPADPNDPGASIDLRDFIAIELVMDGFLAELPEFEQYRGKSFTQDEFPVLVDVIFEDAARRFGPRVDQRD
jgi:hypothetical protein